MFQNMSTWLGDDTPPHAAWLTFTAGLSEGKYAYHELRIGDRNNTVLLCTHDQIVALYTQLQEVTVRMNRVVTEAERRKSVRDAATKGEA